MNTVIICGGRFFAAKAHTTSAGRLMLASLFQAFDLARDHFQIGRVAHGGARGGDQVGDMWARDRGIPVKVYRAEWDKWGVSAGPIRNVAMYLEEKPRCVLAMPGGKGTLHMKTTAHKGGTEVYDIDTRGWRLWTP